MEAESIAKWVKGIGAEVAELKQQLKLAQDANAPLLERVKIAESARKQAEKERDEALALVEEWRGKPEVKKRRLAEIAEREKAVAQQQAAIAAERKKIEAE